MNPEVIICPEPETSVSTFDRPFKLLVKDRTFVIDPKNLSKLSPVFAVMLFGKDFENGRELVREIVDEKSADISTFLKCLDDPRAMNAKNFPTVLRLANKYQVDSLFESCEQFIIDKCDLNRLKADQVLALLISAHEFHLKREAMVKLILRLASEEKTTFNRLKLSRLLPSQMYGAVIGTNINIAQLKEIETMNCHLFKMERTNKTQYKRSPCDECKKITEAAFCEGCRQFLCRMHWKSKKCTSDYGTRLLRELKSNVVELDWE